MRFPAVAACAIAPRYGNADCPRASAYSPRSPLSTGHSLPTPAPVYGAPPVVSP